MSPLLNWNYTKSMPSIARIFASVATILASFLMTTGGSEATVNKILSVFVFPGKMRPLASSGVFYHSVVVWTKTEDGIWSWHGDTCTFMQYTSREYSWHARLVAPVWERRYNTPIHAKWPHLSWEENKKRSGITDYNRDQCMGAGKSIDACDAI